MECLEFLACLDICTMVLEGLFEKSDEVDV